MKPKRVGLFDSGVGGLTVLAACRRELPSAVFYYLGDNARAPYGSRPRGEIARFAEEGMDALARRGIDAAVIACNTVTAVCAEELRERYPFPVLGSEPAVKPAAGKYRRILVLATPRTAESGRLGALLQQFPGCDIAVHAAPSLAGAIEAYLTRGEPFSLSDCLPPASPECVVLGCTHYAFFRREIAAFYGCETFDGAAGTARRLRAVLGGAPSEPVWRFDLGRDDHRAPPMTTARHPNKCSKNTNGRVIFLGKSRKLNETVYYSNVCSIFGENFS